MTHTHPELCEVRGCCQPAYTRIKLAIDAGLTSFEKISRHIHTDKKTVKKIIKETPELLQAYNEAQQAYIKASYERRKGVNTLPKRKHYKTCSKNDCESKSYDKSGLCPYHLAEQDQTPRYSPQRTRTRADIERQDAEYARARFGALRKLLYDRELSFSEKVAQLDFLDS